MAVVLGLAGQAVEFGSSELMPATTSCTGSHLSNRHKGRNSESQLEQTRDSACAAAHFCDSLVGGALRYSDRPGVVGSSECGNNTDIHARADETRAWGEESAGQPLNFKFEMGRALAALLRDAATWEAGFPGPIAVSASEYLL